MVATAVNISVFAWGRDVLRLPRMRMRPYLFQFVYACALTCFAFGELLPRVVAMPCALVDFLCLMIVPCFVAVQFARNSLFLMLTRLANGILKRGVANKDDAQDIGAAPTLLWRVEVTLRAILSLFYPESAESVDNFKRMQHLRELRFLTSSGGLVALLSVILGPTLIVALVFVFSRPWNIGGCIGCVRDMQITIVMIAMSSTFVVFGLVVTYRVRFFIDQYGFRQESRFSLAIVFAALVFYILDQFAPNQDYNSAFNYSILTSLALASAHTALSVVQVAISYRAAQAGRLKKDTAKSGAKAVTGSPAVSSSASSSALGITEDFPGLYHILTRPELVDPFEEFLANEFAIELLVYLKDTHDWATVYFDVAAQARLHRAKRLVAMFVEPSAPMAVNLPHHMAAALREATKRGGTDVPVDIFVPSRLEVAKLLEKGPVMRFANTVQFRMMKADEDVQNLMLSSSVVAPSGMP